MVRGLAIGHHRRGHDVHVIGVVAPPPGDHPFLRELSDAGVTVHPLHLRARAYLTERRAVGGIFSRVRPHVAHLHGYRPELVDGPVARRLGIPTVTTLHGSSRIARRARAYEWVQMRLLHRCDAVVAVSRQIVTELRSTRVPPEQVHYIPNGFVSATPFASREVARSELGVGQDQIVVGWVGRLIPIKGCDVFVRAFAKLDVASARAVIVGDGPERPALETLRDELGLRGRVLFAGSRAQAARLFRAFDVFALSSRSEGTPITLLEAMAAGVPVVAAAVGAIPDLFPRDEAVLVPPEDPVALATAIRRSLADPDAARVRAHAALSKVTGELGADVWLERHEAVYQAIQGRRR